MRQSQREPPLLNMDSYLEGAAFLFVMDYRSRSAMMRQIQKRTRRSDEIRAGTVSEFMDKREKGALRGRSHSQRNYQGMG